LQSLVAVARARLVQVKPFIRGRTISYMSGLYGPSAERLRYSDCLGVKVSSLAFKLRKLLVGFIPRGISEGDLLRQMKTSDFLIKNLGEGVDANLKLASGLTELGILGGKCGVLGLVEQDLGKGLIGERAAHDEGRVTGGTS